MVQIQNTLEFSDSDGGDNHLVAPEDKIVHSWRQQVVGIEKDKLKVRNERLRSEGRVEKVEKDEKMEAC